jgi:hypothetical protein
MPQLITIENLKEALDQASSGGPSHRNSMVGILEVQLKLRQASLGLESEAEAATIAGLLADLKQQLGISS